MLQNWQKKLATTRSVVKKLYDDVVCHLTKAKSATLHEIDECEKQHLQRMLDEKMDMECKVAGLDKNLDFLRITSECASPDQYLYIMKTLSEQKQSLNTLLERMLDNHETTDIHFTPDTNLSRILEESESIGNISVFRKKEEKADKKAVSHSAQAASSMKQNKSFHKPTESCTKPIKPCDDMEALVMVGEGSARIGSMSKLISTKTWNPSLVKSDIEDSIMGAAILGPDRMLLSMRKKKSLALIDGEGRQLDSLSLSHETWGLRMIAPTEGAVVVYDKCLQFFNVIMNKIVKGDALNVPVRRDFAFHKNIYYIGGDKSIMVYDRSQRRLLRDITVSGTVRSIAIRNDTSLYYTVYLENNLYCITMEGTPVFTYSHHKLKWTAGITVDPASNIYICGCNSRNVHQLSHDGKLQRIMFDNLPADPYCISFNTQGDKALIGCADKVLLYDLN